MRRRSRDELVEPRPVGRACPFEGVQVHGAQPAIPAGPAPANLPHAWTASSPAKASLLDARPTSAATRLLAALLDLLVLGVGRVRAAHRAGRARPERLGGAGPDPRHRRWSRPSRSCCPTTVDTLTRGRSLGKLAMGIRIVRDDGGPLVFRQSLVRALVGIVELWLTFGTVALICSIVHPQGKRVGDILAGHLRRARARRGQGARTRDDAAAARRLGALRGPRPAARRPRPVRAAVPRPRRARCTRPHACSWAPS